MAGMRMQESYEDVFEKVLGYQSHPYCIFRIKDDTTVTLEKLGEPSESLGTDHWGRFMKDLQEYDTAYAIFDFKHEAKSGKKDRKIAYILKILSEATVRDKMLYTSFNDFVYISLKKYLGASCKRFKIYSEDEVLQIPAALG